MLTRPQVQRQSKPHLSRPRPVSSTQGQAKTKAVFPKVRPKPRPQLDQANTFSVKHKKSYAKEIQIRENIIGPYTLTSVNVYHELLPLL